MAHSRAKKTTKFEGCTMPNPFEADPTGASPMPPTHNS
jgi:hypothetical protein